MAFFGCDCDDREENVDECILELEQSIENIEEMKERGEEKYFTMEDLEDMILELREESGEFDGMTQEEIDEMLRQEKEDDERERDLMKELMLDGCRERYELLQKLKRIYC
jgi:hypothetical protein